MYHVQCMYRGLGIVGTLGPMCRAYKAAKQQACEKAGVQHAPKVSLSSTLEWTVWYGVMPCSDCLVTVVHMVSVNTRCTVSIQPCTI